MAKSRKSVNKAESVSEATENKDELAAGETPSTAGDLEEKGREAKEADIAESEAVSDDMQGASADEGVVPEKTEPEAENMKSEEEPPEASSDPRMSDEGHEIDAPKQDEDTVAETGQERADQAPLVPVPAPQRSIFWPLVFGGLVAAVLGFIAGRGDQLEPYLPASMQRAQSDLTPIEEQLATLTETATAQAAKIEALENQPASTADIGALSQALDDLQTRLADLEARPVAAPSANDGVEAAEIAALREALDAQQATLDAQRTDIAALLEKTDAAEGIARSEASSLLARAALNRVVTAVETGDTFTPALGDLEETLPVEIPDALRVAAETGVPTLSVLQSDFPEAARAALAAARAEIPEAEVEGLGGFLRRQLGARSIAPREGSDPDAVLSRAEAALRDGELATALGELEALPEVARTSMQGWLDAANARQAAEDAAKALADSLKSN